MGLCLYIPAFFIKLVLPDSGALFFLHDDTLLVRNCLNLCHYNSVALGGVGGLALLLVLRVDNSLKDSL